MIAGGRARLPHFGPEKSRGVLWVSVSYDDGSNGVVAVQSALQDAG